MENSINDLEALNERIKLCKECALAEHRAQVVPGKGSLNAKIVFIGIAPEDIAEREGEPLPSTSYSGQILRQWLSHISLPYESVCVTNILKCNPDRKPQSYRLGCFEEGVFGVEIMACRQWLAQEIIVLQPKVVVTLGAPPLHAFFPRESVSSLGQKGRMCKGRMHFALWHPRNIGQANMRELDKELEERLEHLKHFLKQSELP